MRADIYELLSLGARYWFIFLGLLIVLRCFFWLRKDAKIRKKRLRRLPDAGYIGEFVVSEGTDELPNGTILPVTREGEIGSLRVCDVVVPAPDVMGHHCLYSFEEGNGVVITPLPGTTVWVDGQEYTHRSREKAVLYHASVLEIGAVALRLRLFVGVNARQAESVGTAQRQEFTEEENEEDSYEEDEER